MMWCDRILKISNTKPFRWQFFCIESFSYKPSPEEQFPKENSGQWFSTLTIPQNHLESFWKRLLPKPQPRPSVVSRPAVPASLATCQKYKFPDPAPDPANQKLWGWGPCQPFEPGLRWFGSSWSSLTTVPAPLTCPVSLSMDYEGQKRSKIHLCLQ